MSRSIILAVDIEADPEAIFDALTTTDGLAAFWTPRVDGDAHAGGLLHLGFEAAPVDLEVSVALADRDTHTVQWECNGPWPYWTGTSIEWSTVDAGPRLLFAHGGWTEEQPESEFGSVAYTWAMVLQALKAFSESGVPAPALK